MPSPDPEWRTREAQAVLSQTRQATPLPRAMPNETGLIPGQTTQTEAFAREDWLSKSIWSNGRHYNFSVRGYWVAFAGDLVEQVDLSGSAGVASTVIAQYGPPELVVFYLRPYMFVYPTRGVAFQIRCVPSTSLCLNDLTQVPVVARYYFIPMTLNEWVAREQPYWPEGHYIQAWGR